MMLLYASALGLGLVHTLLGPDHYLPFVAMSKAGGWNRRKTLRITVLCGAGHILGSLVLGLLGVLLGLSVGWVEVVESFRGDLAGWMLLTFGLIFFIWGLRKAARGRKHSHLHVHDDGTAHTHGHSHSHGHLHVHAKEGSASMTPWVLFTIFLFGPCEPLIPLLMYPAAKGSIIHVFGVGLVFGVATVTTMTVVVMAGVLGTARLQWGWMEQYSSAIAGFIILLSGAAVVLGL